MFFNFLGLNPLENEELILWFSFFVFGWLWDKIKGLIDDILRYIFRHLRRLFDALLRAAGWFAHIVWDLLKEYLRAHLRFSGWIFELVWSLIKPLLEPFLKAVEWFLSVIVIHLFPSLLVFKTAERKHWQAALKGLFSFMQRVARVFEGSSGGIAKLVDDLWSQAHNAIGLLGVTVAAYMVYKVIDVVLSAIPVIGGVWVGLKNIIYDIFTFLHEQIRILTMTYIKPILDVIKPWYDKAKGAIEWINRKVNDILSWTEKPLIWLDRNVFGVAIKAQNRVDRLIGDVANIVGVFSKEKAEEIRELSDKLDVIGFRDLRNLQAELRGKYRVLRESIVDIYDQFTAPLRQTVYNVETILSSTKNIVDSVIDEKQRIRGTTLYESTLVNPDAIPEAQTDSTFVEEIPEYVGPEPEEVEPLLPDEIAKAKEDVLKWREGNWGDVAGHIDDAIEKALEGAWVDFDKMVFTEAPDYLRSGS